MKKFIALLLACVMLVSLVGCQTPEQETPADKYRLDEARNEVIIEGVGAAQTGVVGNQRLFYHIFVGSFSDSNGDGVGDLRGIINRFDYLNDGNPDSGVSLGVEGIWLSPIFVSPSYHKYDVTDYYTVDPKFGTEEDLYELIQLCHQRDVKIILDLVINHTSTNHTWFQGFRTAHQNGDTGNMYYDFYSWAEEPAPGKTYQTVAGSNHYYECNFSGSMPELNFDNETVKQEMVNVARYYLNLGVDGFRFDAAKYVYFGDDTQNIPFWDWYMAQLREIKSDIYTVAEVWDSDGVTIPYFSSTDCFNFTMAQVSGKVAQTAKNGNVNTLTAYVENYIAQIKEQRPEAMPVTFIANHDTDRAAGFLTVSGGEAKVAANLAILMPGSTFVYYGEEIGMKGSRGGANTDANRRLAMNWGDGDTVSDPEGADYSAGQTNGSVADQLPNGDSLYNHYKKLIMIRKAHPEIACGTYQPIQIPDSNLGGFLSTYNGSSVAVFHNTSGEEVQLDLAQLEGISLTEITAFAGVGEAKLDGTVLTIAGQTSVVLK